MQTTLALLGAVLASLCEGHLIMATPKPYGLGVIDNSPLSTSGTNYPCKVTSDPATFYDTTKYPSTSMAIGEKQTLSFTGSAVHGGGSCQLAVTDDKQPSATTSWQVILSIEGGCPSTDGNGPSTYDYTIPDTVAPGDYSFAWTWISKEAGTGEFYMNCAPITVTAATSKRDAVIEEDEDEAYANSTMVARDSTLPELFVANVGSTINTCTTSSGFDYVYPNPGPNVSKPGSTPEYKDAPDTNCVPKGLTDSSAGSSGSAASSAAGGAAASSSTSAAASSAAATTLETSTTSAAAAATSVFVSPVTSSATASAAATFSASEPASSAAAATTTAAAATTKTASAATGSASATGSAGGSGAAGALSGACTTEGEWNCDGSQYQQCASGSWTGMSALPSGTTCVQGLSTTLWNSAKGRRATNMMRRVRKANGKV